MNGNKPENPGEGHGRPDNPGNGHGHGRPDVPPKPPKRPVG